MINQHDNPWAGLSAYKDPESCSDPLKFCGRNIESYDVSQLIDDNILVTLYGKSGTGKTSLLNAGVFPRLRDKRYLPISIRLAMEANGTSFQACILLTIKKVLADKNYQTKTYDVIPMPKDEQVQEYLWSFFARNHFTDEEGRSIFPVIVLDQFEEVFKNRKSEAEVLLRQMNYMMDESHALSDRTVNGGRYTYDFNYRFVISIREDDLYSLEDSIDNNYLNAMKFCRYRLRCLSDDGAREAILLPGEGLFDEHEKEQIADAIIETARNTEDGTIGTNIISLICSRLYIESRKTRTQQISSELVKNYIADNPFEKYYYEATAGFSNKERSYIERHLIDSSGRRNSISESDFFKHIKNGEALLEGPQKILQRISISTDSKDNRIELIHDSFCAPLAELKQKRLLRKRLRMFFVSMCITAISVAVIALVLYQKRQVEKLNSAMLENNSRFVAEKASTLVDEGDSYTARLLALAILPPNRPYVVEAEAALRNAACHNSAVLKGHKNCVCFVSFSNDGKQVISRSEDSTTIYWDANNGRMITPHDPIRIADRATTIDGHKSARICEGIDNSKIEIYDTRTGRIYHKLDGHKGKVNAIAVSPNGELLASASDDNSIKLWDISDGKEIIAFVGHSNDVTCLSFSPDGNRLVSGSKDNTVRLWDIANYSEKTNLTSTTIIWPGSSFSQNGKYIAAIADSSLFGVWETENGNKKYSYQGPQNIRRVAFDPTQEDILILASGKTLYYWNAKTTLFSDSLIGHKGIITSIKADHNGKYVLSSSFDSTAIIWDAQTKKQIRILAGHGARINYATFSRNANLVATASDDNTVKIWETKTGSCLHTLIGHEKAVISVDFSPNEKLLASTSKDNTIKIWNVQTGKCIKTINGHLNEMLAVQFYSDDILVSASSTDGLIKVWDIPTGTLLSSYGIMCKLLRNILVVPDNNTILSVFSNGTCEKWRFPSIEELIQDCQKKMENVQLSSEDKRKYYIQ